MESETNRNKTTNDDEKKRDPGLEREMREKKKLRTIQEHHIWRQKIFRFLTYSISGLSDYMFTFENFIDHLTKCQSSGHDLNDFIIDALNVRDLEAMRNPHEDIMNMKSVQISSLNEKSNISFNEEALAIAIKSGWLTEHLSDNLKNLPEFIKLILAKYSSNKILSKIYFNLDALNGYLKSLVGQGGEEVSYEIRKQFTDILSYIANIFNDARKCPITLVISAKCLCALVAKDIDKTNKLILIAENVVTSISKYIEVYDYDEKVVLICLELFSLILPEIKLTLSEVLYGDCRLVEKLKVFLNKTNVPGTYYSQRVNL
jgi:hypothetical protein